MVVLKVPEALALPAMVWFAVGVLTVKGSLRAAGAVQRCSRWVVQETAYEVARQIAKCGGAYKDGMRPRPTVHQLALVPGASKLHQGGCST
jgi:hypothetical protein